MKSKSRLIVLSVVSIALAVGCASTQQARIQGAGPGTLFETVEAAAIDGLSYAYREAANHNRRYQMSGGTIRTVPGGYTYDEIVWADPWNPDKVKYTLGADTVAHFHTYPPEGVHQLDRANEEPSPEDRRVVDELDPRHRPLFILTPSLKVRAYAGPKHGTVDIADLRRPGEPVVIGSIRH